MTNKAILRYTSIISLIIAATIGFAYNSNATFKKTALEMTTETTAELNSETSSESNSTEAFDKVMMVLTHKRCMNCHPAADRPHQGEDSHIHNFNVQRGSSNMGAGALSCNTCHHEENNDLAGVPGAPEWSLAPKRMAWEGLNRVEIAKSILDPTINGGRTLAETVKHLTEHELVLWAWNPGVDASGKEREKPPVPKEEYIAAVKEWAANGAIIPEK